MLAVGVTGIYSTTKEWKRGRRFRARAVRVPGVVVDLSWERGTSDGPHLGMPVFQYHTREGHPMQAKDPVGTNPPRFRPGMHVAVLYDPEEPYRAQLEGSIGLGKGMNVVGFLLSCLALVGGLTSLAGELALT
ncbi:hypothetical protein GCM10010399_04350 [Dactylosporangium fulvum]